MLFAVHISDGVLGAPWWLGAIPVALLLLWLGSFRLADEEVPRIALLTAAFFIASSIHVRVPPTSCHLLLNGLVGVLLGPRAALAIGVGLLLQVLLLNHGGYQTLAINTCILSLPALLAGALFQGLQRVDWLRARAGRRLLVASAALIWLFGAAYSIALLRQSSFRPDATLDWALVHAAVLQPWFIASALLAAAGAVWCEQRLETAPEFPLGFLIGLVSVFATVALNALVLVLGGEEVWQVPAMIWVLVHLPVAIVEGAVLGFTVGFLARVKPELLMPPVHSAPARSASDACPSLALRAGSEPANSAS